MTLLLCGAQKDQFSSLKILVSWFRRRHQHAGWRVTTLPTIGIHLSDTAFDGLVEVRVIQNDVG